MVYLGDSGRLFTTGFSKFSDRQYAIWSQNDLSNPVAMEIIDSSSGEQLLLFAVSRMLTGYD